MVDPLLITSDGWKYVIADWAVKNIDEISRYTIKEAIDQFHRPDITTEGEFSLYSSRTDMQEFNKQFEDIKCWLITDLLDNNTNWKKYPSCIGIKFIEDRGFYPIKDGWKKIAILYGKTIRGLPDIWFNYHLHLSDENKIALVDTKRFLREYIELVNSRDGKRFLVASAFTLAPSKKFKHLKNIVMHDEEFNYNDHDYNVHREIKRLEGIIDTIIKGKLREIGSNISLEGYTDGSIYNGDNIANLAYQIRDNILNETGCIAMGVNLKIHPPRLLNTMARLEYFVLRTNEIIERSLGGLFKKSKFNVKYIKYPYNALEVNIENSKIGGDK